MFRHGIYGIHNRPCHQAEIRPARSDFGIPNPVDEAVEGARGPLFKPGSSLLDPLCQHQLIPLLSQRQHFLYQGGRVLPVPVHGDDVITDGMRHTGGQGCLMAEVAAELQHLYPRIGGLQILQDGGSLVA